MSGMTLDQLPSAIANADNLPSPPNVALEVMRVADDPNARAEDLGAIIRNDPALAIRLLRTVNSPAFGLPKSVDSVERACTLLGFPKAKTLALGYSVADALPTVGPESGFDLSEYWMRSGLTASAAELFARRMTPEHADVAFVVGLLSEVGRLLLAGCLTSVYKTLLVDDPWPSPHLERARLGFSNLDISSALFRSWDLPPEIVEPIAHRDAPEQLPADASTDVIRLCRVLAPAEILARVWASGAKDNDLDWAGDAAAHYLEMPPEMFVDVVDELRTKVETSEAFRAVSPPASVNVKNLEQETCDRLKTAVSRSATGSRVAQLLRQAG
jgi:HD-like signal output (HDOD) protein